MKKTVLITITLLSVLSAVTMSTNLYAADSKAQPSCGCNAYKHTEENAVSRVELDNDVDENITMITEQ